MVSNWAERVGETARDTVCSALATSENLAGFLDSLFPNGDWDNQIAGGIRRGFCGNPDDAPSPDDFVPFQGGQCPGVSYFVNFTRANGSTSALGDVVGPVGFETEQITVSACGTTEFTQYFVTGGNGSRTSLGTNRDGTTCNTLPGNASITGVTRNDGLPDDCGNPPPDIPPFQPITISNSVTYVDNTNTEITENYDFTINIPVIIGGILIAPVTVAGNNFNLNLSVPISGNIRFEFGQNRNVDTNTGGETPPPDPTTEPGGSETERRIIAVLVTATVNPATSSLTKILQGDNPDIWAPRLGNVNFYVAAGSAAGWTEDIPIKNLRSYIRCPVPQGAINVAATPVTGVSLTLTKIFSSQESYRSQIGA